jgi:hypothetical protein
MDLFIPDYWVRKDFEAREKNNEVHLFNLKSFEGIYHLGYKAMLPVESQGLFFDPQNGGYTFLWNVGWLSTDYMAFYHTKQNSSKALLW